MGTNGHVALDGLTEDCRVVGFDGRYVYVNDAAAAEIGCPRGEVVGREFGECDGDGRRGALAAALRRCLATRAAEEVDEEVVGADGATRFYEARVTPTAEGACAVVRDVTGRRRRDDAERHALWMDAYSRLIGGLSHDLGHLLTIIISYVDLLLDVLDPANPVREDVAEIERGSRRLVALYHEVSAYAGGVGRADEIDLNELVRELSPGAPSGLNSRCGDIIEVVRVLDPRLARVKCDGRALNSILVQLAVEALRGEHRGRRLVLRSEDVVSEGGPPPVNPGGLPAGRYATLVVAAADVAGGRSVAERMPVPFVSIDGGRRVSLRVAAASAFVRRCGGVVTEEWVAGRGATFRVYLPVSEG